MFRNGIDAQKLQGGKHQSIESSDLVVTIVGFVAAAVSMPMGGCRAIRPVVDVSVAAVAVGLLIAAELAVL